MPYSGANVINIPGSLYAAPIGTVEPTAVTGAWPTGWLSLGYTTAGSTFTNGLTTGTITPEEEFYPIRTVVTAATATLAFNLLELTQRNWQLALNNGILAPGTSQNSGTNTDGSYWVEPAAIGTELRVMLGWDSFTNGGTTGTVGGRLVCRQCLQTGSLGIQRAKGASPAFIPTSFSLEKPPSVQPWRLHTPQTMGT